VQLITAKTLYLIIDTATVMPTYPWRDNVQLLDADSWQLMGRRLVVYKNTMTWSAFIMNEGRPSSNFKSGFSRQE
jgi:hypothetical protein